VLPITPTVSHASMKLFKLISKLR